MSSSKASRGLWVQLWSSSSHIQDLITCSKSELRPWPFLAGVWAGTELYPLAHPSLTLSVDQGNTMKRTIGAQGSTQPSSAGFSLGGLECLWVLLLPGCSMLQTKPRAIGLKARTSEFLLPGSSLVSWTFVPNQSTVHPPSIAKVIQLKCRPEVGHIAT